VGVIDQLALLLDDEDTAVIEAAAETLVTAGRDMGLALVLQALADSPDDVGYHIRDKLITIWLDGFPLKEACSALLAGDSSELQVRGAREMLEALGGDEHDVR
jgi:hypothetical protein